MSDRDPPATRPGSPFEDGAAAGRRAYTDPAFASGLSYGLLAAKDGVATPGTPPPPKLRPAQVAVLEALRARTDGQGPFLVEDLVASLAAAGHAMRRDNVRTVLNGLIKKNLARRVAAVGKSNHRPAWAYEATP